MPAWSAVTHCVDAAVYAVQLSAADAVSYRPRPQAGGFELPPRDDSVLSPRDPRHLKIGHVDFLTHVGT